MTNQRGDQFKLLTVLERLFDPTITMVVTRHLYMVSITNLTAGGIFNGLEETLQRQQLPLYVRHLQRHEGGKKWGDSKITCTTAKGN